MNPRYQIGRRVKPKVGDLVKLIESHYDHWPDRVARPTGDGLLGVIVRCVGIRCKVHWTDGKYSAPEREHLEVLNESR